MYFRHFVVLIFSAITVFSFKNFATANNATVIDDGIIIKSDELIIDSKNYRSIFHGNIVVEFEEYDLFTSELIVNYEKDETLKKNVIKEIIMPNDVIFYNNDKSRVITAKTGKYTLNNRQLILKEKVRINEKNDVIVTEKLIYKLNAKKTSAK